jgi:hypothetical protein
MKFDLHVHTSSSSCGLSSPAAVIRWALKRGLDGIAVTDHDTMTGVAEAQALAPPGFLVIPGVEYLTDHGHILALFCETFADTLPRGRKGRVPLAILSPFVRERGGLVVAAHPYQHAQYRDDDAPWGLSESMLRQVDGLEGVNGRALSRDPGSFARVNSAAQDRKLFTTGGSDAHLSLEIGRCCTVFPPGTEKSLPALRDALLRGGCTVEGKPGHKAYRVASRLLRKVRGAE